jgi:hypothetical protein
VTLLTTGNSVIDVILIVTGATSFAFSRPTIHLLLRPKRHLYYMDGPPSLRKLVAYLSALVIVDLIAFILVMAAQASGLFVQRLILDTILIVAAFVGIVGLVCVFSLQIKQFWWTLRRKAGGTASKMFVAVFLALILLPSANATGLWLLRCFFLLWSATIPVLMFLLFRSVIYRSKLSDLANKPTRRVKSSARAGLRVVVMIFDELDQRIGFDERPSEVLLPCMDLLLSESLACSAAYPPANCTEISIPAFLTGKLVEDTFVEGPTSIGLRFSGSLNYEPFREQHTLFHKLSDRSVNCGVVMSYHPIGRLFGDVLTDYHWLEGLSQECSINGSVAKMTAQFCRSLLETPKYSLFGNTLTSRMAISHYLQSSAAANRMASDSRLGAAILHWTIPHAPYIYNRKTNKLGNTTMGAAGYLDNVVLTDAAVGRIRAHMTGAGLWNESAVIVTSDHWWRYASGFDGKTDRRVPFIVHFPGECHRTDYEKPFNTVALHDVILALVDGVVGSSSDLVAWLDTHTAYSPPAKV